MVSRPVLNRRTNNSPDAYKLPVLAIFREFDSPCRREGCNRESVIGRYLRTQRAIHLASLWRTVVAFDLIMGDCHNLIISNSSGPYKTDPDLISEPTVELGW